MDGYTVPNYGKKSRKNRSDRRTLTFAEKLERERSSLRNDSEWLGKIHGMIRDILGQLNWLEAPSLCCLGLGSPSESRSARLQLALILELIAHAKIAMTNASFYDPVFTDEDMKGFEKLGLNAVSGQAALAASHLFSQPTIVVMPHCDIELYSKLLESNWSPERLTMVLILGNPLDQYLLTTPKGRLDTEFLHVKRIANYPNWRILPFPDATCDDKAFVALAFQYLVRDGQSTEGLPLWKTE